MVTEKLRQNDETLKEVLEERQTLIAELLHVQPSDLADKVRVSIHYTNLEHHLYDGILNDIPGTSLKLQQNAERAV